MPGRTVSRRFRLHGMLLDFGFLVLVLARDNPVLGPSLAIRLPSEYRQLRAEAKLAASLFWSGSQTR
jgi:hypothetical protein